MDGAQQKGEIVEHMDDFNKAINDKNFKSKYGEIRGEKNKVIPGEFKDAAEKQPLIYNKQFYYFGQMEAEAVLKDDLIDLVYDYYKAAKGIREFLAISSILITMFRLSQIDFLRYCNLIIYITKTGL